MTATIPALSVIVPVFNGRLQLPRCLEALRASAFTDFEVIVVDDCSTDNTRQIAERSGARYLRTPWNMGPGGARNIGVRHAHGEIVVFIDADVVVAPETLGQIHGDFEQDAELAAVFGSYDEEPAWPDFLSQYKNLMHHYVHQQASEAASTFWAGCGAIRKKTYEEFGGFDTARYTQPSIEDIDLGFRMWRGGRRIHLDKKIQVKHLKKWTVRGLLRADIAMRAAPWSRLILESRTMPSDLNLTWAARISTLLSGLLVLSVLLLPVAAFQVLPGLTLASLGAAMGTVVVLLVLINWPVYAWFAERRGWLFMCGAMLAHWAYFFYSGATFVLCWVAHHRRGAPRDPRLENISSAHGARAPME